MFQRQNILKEFCEMKMNQRFVVPIHCSIECYTHQELTTKTEIAYHHLFIILGIIS